MLAAEVLARLDKYDLGRAVTVPGGYQVVGTHTTYYPGPAVDLVDADFGQALAVSLLVQQTGGSFSSGKPATITVRYELGSGAWFQKQFPAPLVPQSIRLFARSVYVYAQGSGTGEAQVSAGIAPEDVNPLSELVVSWVLDSAVAASDSPVSGSGYVIDVSGSCNNLGGATALWLFVFDSSQLPLQGVAVGAGGTGFTGVPTITFTGGQSGTGATPAEATATMGSSTTVTVTAGGSGYTTASVTASAPQLPGGVQAQYTATVSGGVVTAVNCIQQGSGYTSAPVLTILGNGSGATASTTLSVVFLNMTSGGGGYTSSPTLGASGGGGSGFTGTSTLTTGGQGIVPPLMLTQTGQFGFADELRVKAAYTTGLTWALSSSQSGFAVPSGSPTARIDLGVGS